MMRRDVSMPGVVRVTAGQRKRPSVAPVIELRPKKLPPGGYQWPEHGAIRTIFQEAKKYR